MNNNVIAKRNVLTLMRRLGLDERMGHAAPRLPDPVDVVRDSAILTDLGLEFDDIVNQLGGSAW
jgi:hypothetical protein